MFVFYFTFLFRNARRTSERASARCTFTSGVRFHHPLRFLDFDSDDSFERFSPNDTFYPFPLLLTPGNSYAFVEFRSNRDADDAYHEM